MEKHGPEHCPKATLDVAENLKNRKVCIKVADYGPPNPYLPSDAYWQRRADEWGVTPAEARMMRCGNCGAFNVSRRMLACIAQGIGTDGIDPYDTITASDLGYCQMFRFKCAASRTCSAWIVGGPIRK